MTPERWQYIKEIFHGALARPATDRASFIDSACAGDEAARREVSQLVSAHEEEDEFLDTPAFEVLARSLAGAEPAGLAQGQHVGRYRVTGSLGAGGMGEVYLAEDSDLGRKVALKLLPASFTVEADRVRRFEREARAASSPNHPNVCTIYEVGEAADGRRYIVMEHVEGSTLRRHMSGGRMEVADVLDVAAQIASGLAAAHAAGVVHRDIKPENVMLRPDGIVKVLDFGLAKLTAPQPAAGPAAPAPPHTQTETGVVMGTATYMSPEQARGLETDARTDVWSLGVVLYEMAAGRAPFEGETNSDVIVSVLEREPPLPGDREVPAGLWRVISKALRKDKTERYQTAHDMALDLKGLKEQLEVAARLEQGLWPNPDGREFAASGGGFGAADFVHEPATRAGHVPHARPTGIVRYLVGEINRRKSFAAGLLVLLVGATGLTYFATGRNKADSGGSGVKSLAVLPLRPIGLAGRDEIYEVGIADSLIHRLSAVKGLMVRPLSATRRYAGVEQDPLAAGREQQADYVLASNFQLAAGRIRITAQLFNVASGQVEETYKSEKDAGNVFAMQDAVADEVKNLFLARFATSPSGPAAKRGTANEEAYRLYLQGMYLVEKEESLADSKRAVELFDQALSLDPNYAQAWAGKARAHCVYAHWGGSTPDAEYVKAKPALERAFMLDNNLPEAYGVLGIIRADYDWNFADADRHFLRAIEIAPNSAIVHRWYAEKLAVQGRSEEAIARAKIAIDLNPNSVAYQFVYGRALYYARRYDDAITQLERVVEMDSARPYVYSLLWRAYHQKGDHPRAHEARMRLLRLIGTKDETLKTFETLYVRSGWESVLLGNLEDIKANDTKGSAAYLIAVLSALSGEREQSFRYLDEAVKNRSLEIPNVFGDPALDSLRGDPRFAELVGRVRSQRR